MARQRERERHTYNPRIRKLVFVRHRLGLPVGLSSPRLAFAGWGRPLRRRIVTAGARALGHPAHPRPCRVPRTHPCSHAMLLHASIAVPLEHCSNCASEALGPLFLSAGPSVPVGPTRLHILARVVRHVPEASTISVLFIFLLLTSGLSCVSSRSDLHSHVLACPPVMPLACPRLTFTSPASVLLHT